MKHLTNHLPKWAWDLYMREDRWCNIQDISEVLGYTWDEWERLDKETRQCMIAQQVWEEYLEKYS